MAKTVAEKAKEQLLDVLDSDEIHHWASKSFIYIDEYRDVDFSEGTWRIDRRWSNIREVLDALIAAPPGYPKASYDKWKPSRNILRRALAEYHATIDQDNTATDNPEKEDNMFSNEMMKLMMIQQMVNGTSGANGVGGLFGGLVAQDGGFATMMQNELKIAFGQHLAKVLDNLTTNTQISVGTDALVKLENGKWQPVSGGDEVTSLNIVLMANSSGQQLNFNMLGTGLFSGVLG